MMTMTKGVSLLLAVIMCFLSSVTGADFFAFHKELADSKQFDIQGIATLTYDEGVINTRYNDQMRQVSILNDVAEGYATLLDVTPKIMEGTVKYQLKGNFTDMKNPEADFSIKYNASYGEYKYKGTLRLIFTNKIAYTDVETVRCILDTLFSLNALGMSEDTETKNEVLKAYDEYIAQTKLEYYKLYEYTSEDYELLFQDLMETSKDEAAIIDEVTALVGKILKGYKTDMISKTEDGYKVEVGVEQLVPELESLYGVYKTNKSTVVKDLYTFIKKISAQYGNEAFVTYDEFLKELAGMEKEVENVINVLKNGGKTDDEKIFYDFFKNSKGSKMIYNISKKDGVYGIKMSAIDKYKDKMMVKLEANCEYKTKVDKISAPKGKIKDIFEAFNEIDLD